jgi:Flp pilus assembly protein TadG
MTKRIHNPRISGLATDDGQSIVEFTLVMPFLVFLLVGICQFGLAFHDYLSVTDAARVGARKAAVSRAAAGGPCQAARDAIQATVSSEQWSAISTRITCSPGTPGDVGSSYTISISHPFTIGLPAIFGFNAFSYGGNMTSSATERLE